MNWDHFIWPTRRTPLGTDLFENNGIEWYERKDSATVAATNATLTNASTMPTMNDTHMNDQNILYNTDNSRCFVTDHQFYCGIYFPNDAIIDSSQYAKCLINDALQHQSSSSDTCSSSGGNTIRTMMNTTVTKICRLKDVVSYQEILSSTQHNQRVVETSKGTTDTSRMCGAIVECRDTSTQRSFLIYCRHVVVATGGLSVPQGCCMEDLYGIVRPCYSYLAHVPMTNPMMCEWRTTISQNENDNTTTTTTTTTKNSSQTRSPNYFSWQFTHDWCYTDRYCVRVSGEDHYSARKDSQQFTRCQNLIRWTLEQYGSTDRPGDKKDVNGSDKDCSTIPQQSGVYTVRRKVSLSWFSNISHVP
jgi:hypothetical protein